MPGPVTPEKGPSVRRCLATPDQPSLLQSRVLEAGYPAASPPSCAEPSTELAQLRSVAPAEPWTSPWCTSPLGTALAQPPSQPPRAPQLAGSRFSDVQSVSLVRSPEEQSQPSLLQPRVASTGPAASHSSMAWSGGQHPGGKLPRQAPSGMLPTTTAGHSPFWPSGVPPSRSGSTAATSRDRLGHSSASLLEQSVAERSKLSVAEPEEQARLHAENSILRVELAALAERHWLLCFEVNGTAEEMRAHLRTAAKSSGAPPELSLEKVSQIGRWFLQVIDRLKNHTGIMQIPDRNQGAGALTMAKIYSPQ